MIKNRILEKVCTYVVVSMLAFGILPDTKAFAAAAPAPIGPVPSSVQLEWQKEELTAFIHFGMNTFTDREWGTGTESPSQFNPTALDATQWVTTLKNAGFKKIIFTAKHHDGFCLWPSAYTTHDVAGSPWKNGQGDVVKEVSDACRAAGLKFGIYLSPWDMHESTFNSGEAYNTFYKNQLRELLTNYGTISEIWWDGAGEGTQVYDFAGWSALVRELQPTCAIFGCRTAANYVDLRWCGTEAGYAGDPCWSTLNPNTVLVENTSLLKTGEMNGTKWIPSEVDVSIRPGWFYHESQDSQVKTPQRLYEIYLNSVGHNAQLLLNIPPDRRGLINEKDVASLNGFHEMLQTTYTNNLAAGASVTASTTRGTGFEGSKITDGDTSTYWAATDGTLTATLDIDMGASKQFDTIVLQEPIQLGQRISSYSVQVWNGTDWTTIADKQTIGYKWIVKSSTLLNSQKIRISIKGSKACPAINNIGVYKGSAPVTPQDPTQVVNLALNKTVTATNTHSTSFEGKYAVDGNTSTRWATADNITSATFEVDFFGQTEFNKVVINQLGTRIKNFTLQYFTGFSWEELYSGTNPASVQTIVFPKVSSNKIRLNINSINGNLGPSIYEFEVYNDPNASNIAYKKTATSDSEEAGNLVSYGNDGNTSTRWCASNGNANHWWKVDLGANYDITGTEILWEQNQVYKYKIEVSADNVNWIMAADKTGNTLSSQTTTDSMSATGRYMRVTITGVSNGKWPSFYEFRAEGTTAVSNTYISDLTWTSSTNGWGPVEKDKSNGEQASGDGRTITLNGTTYAKGLGCHANSTVIYNIAGKGYTRFQSDIGIDDEQTASAASVVFQVWLDGVKVYDSGTMGAATATKSVDVDVTGKSELKLVVTDAGNGNGNDHADWAGAKLIK